MSNHLHLIVQSKDNDLSGLIRDLKKFTAKNIISLIRSEPENRREWILRLLKEAAQTHSRNKEYQFWKYGNHPEEIYTDKFMWSKLDYIHLNPIRAGLVSRALHYQLSSATNYVNGKGLLEITLVDNPVINVHDDTTFFKSIVW